MSKITDENEMSNIKDNNYIALNNGDIVVADASEDYKGIGDACVLDLNKHKYKIVAGLHTIAFRPNKGLNSDFFFIFLHTSKFKHYGYKVGTGLKVFGITYSNLAKMPIKIPTYKEQYKISKLFDLIEKIIALQQQKNTLLMALKQAFLQKLFAKNVKTPRLRFNGFTDSWKQLELGKIATIVGGGTPSTKKESYWSNGKINWYSPDEIGNSVFVTSSKRKITKSGLKFSSAKLLPGRRTILFTSRAGIGKMAIMLTDGATNQGFQSWVIQPSKTDIYFLFSLGTLIKKQALRKASGSTFLEISNSEVKKLNIKIPTLAEQKNIGNFLKTLHNVVHIQQKEISILLEIKKFLLQNMFI